MQKSEILIKKKCSVHNDAQIKYICMDKECLANNPLACAECILEGPHE